LNLYYDRDFKYSYLLACLIFCLLLQFGEILQFHPSFGPLFKMVAKMLTDFFQFLTIYAILLIMFAVSGNILFNLTIPAYYGQLYLAMRTMFDASLANYDFSVFESDSLTSTNQVIGNIYLFIAVLLFNVLILNFIIAILSNTFNVYEPMSKGLYLIQILDHRPIKTYDEKYGALLSAQPPLNLHTIVGSPVYIFKSNPRRFN